VSAGITAICFATITTAQEGQARTTKTVQAEVRRHSLEGGLASFRLQHGRYPTTQEGLAILIRERHVDTDRMPVNRSGEPLDPWGRPYLYDPEVESKVVLIPPPEESSNRGSVTPVILAGLALAIVLFLFVFRRQRKPRSDHRQKKEPLILLIALIGDQWNQ
jgi:hypothetical protein